MGDTRIIRGVRLTRRRQQYDWGTGTWQDAEVRDDAGYRRTYTITWRKDDRVYHVYTQGSCPARFVAATLACAVETIRRDAGLSHRIAPIGSRTLLVPQDIAEVGG